MRAHRTRIVSAIASVLIVASSAVAGATVAVTPALAGTGSWGPAGAISTDSAVTVNWDESASPNAGDDTVLDRRDPSTVIAHTAGKTVADISSKLTKNYKAAFAADGDGRGLSMTVSQTNDLMAQGVTVSVSGARGGAAPGLADTEWLEVFQCWGAGGEADPRPERCQTGAGGSDVDAGGVNFRAFGRDPLRNGGDWDGLTSIPFEAVDGTTYGGVITGNPYFNRTTTNEFTRLRIGPAGTAERTFELQSTTESQGLGCGSRQGQASTDTCWLVAVPMLASNNDLGLGAAGGNPSALTPSLWAQRLQVKLAFQPIFASCGDGGQTLSVGSELLSPAVRGWSKGICNEKHVSLGYSKSADPQVRTAVATGASTLGFTTQPIEAGGGPTAYAPTALSGVVFALNLDYRPCGRGNPDTAVERCGYPDRKTADAEIAKTGTPVRDVRLNARLVAKLLTQSYGIWMTAEVPTLLANAPWAQGFNGGSLFLDPEFQALNPQLRYMDFGRGSNERQLQTEILRSDAASAVWSWILGDAQARAFLDGCPDRFGAVVNPFYSTRTYAECASRATELERSAFAIRHATASPEDFNRSQAATYPPSDASYPTVLYAEEDAKPDPVNPDQTVPPGTLVDLLPKLADMESISRATLRANPPAGRWCASYTDDIKCTPPQWKSVQGLGQAVGERVVLSITDAADAARYLLPTALLCDGSDATPAHCVGADTASMTKAAGEFAKSSVDGVLQPAAKADYAGGAYPLTLPVYGVVNTQKLSSADAKPIADILEYAATSGQKPGTRPGQLAPGYAPLTAPLVAQAQATVAKLRALTDPVAAAPAAVPAAPTGPVGAVPTTVEVPTDGSSAAPTAPPMKQTSAALGKTAPTEIGFPQFGLATGLLAALAAGILSPVLGRRRKGGAA
ncbi:hypothetical protein [Leifsonia sp. 71-9]|uniref:hypothetical protein n=1 Tax=Leifsonia sp. 71-9 TaxID=1895934 RepID=UPI000ADB72B1|nr:hypothetical protein [Leifsonia sp. 71-9]